MNMCPWSTQFISAAVEQRERAHREDTAAEPAQHPQAWGQPLGERLTAHECELHLEMSGNQSLLDLCHLTPGKGTHLCGFLESHYQHGQVVHQRVGEPHHQPAQDGSSGMQPWRILFDKLTLGQSNKKKWAWLAFFIATGWLPLITMPSMRVSIVPLHNIHLRFFLQLLPFLPIKLLVHNLKKKSICLSDYHKINTLEILVPCLPLTVKWFYPSKHIPTVSKTMSSKGNKYMSANFIQVPSPFVHPNT